MKDICTIVIKDEDGSKIKVTATFKHGAGNNGKPLTPAQDMTFEVMKFLKDKQI